MNLYVFTEQCVKFACVRLKELLSAFLDICFCFRGAHPSFDLRWHSSPRSLSSVLIKNGVANHRPSDCSSHVGNVFHVGLILLFYLSRCPSHQQPCVWRREDTWSLWSCAFVWHHAVDSWFQSALPPLLMTPDRLITDKMRVCVGLSLCWVGPHTNPAIRQLSN